MTDRLVRDATLVQRQITPRKVALGVALAISAAPAGGMLLLLGGSDARGCLPPDPVVRPLQAAPGSTVVVTIAANSCTRGYASDTSYRLSVASSEAKGQWLIGEFTIDGDGAFEQTVSVPTDAVLGAARLMVNSDAFPPCDDGAQCMGPNAQFTVTQDP